MTEHTYGDDELEALLVVDAHAKSTGVPIHSSSFTSN